jgi:hypothetical protein
MILTLSWKESTLGSFLTFNCLVAVYTQLYHTTDRSQLTAPDPPPQLEQAYPFPWSPTRSSAQKRRNRLAKLMDRSAVALRGKSSWISIIGSTVTEGCLHAEHVTVEVRDPAKVWSNLSAWSRIIEVVLAHELYSYSSTFDLWQ